jgi:hypothetical protein
MSAVVHRLEPVFDFTPYNSNVLLNQSQVEVNIDGHLYKGDGEVRLDLSPRPNIHLYGKFQDVPASEILDLQAEQKTISSFSINGYQVEGFSPNGGDVTGQEMTVKWCPRSEPINGIGNESTEMARVMFHLFNFVPLLGMRPFIEYSGTKRYRIEHIDLICDEWKVELKSLLETKDNFKVLKAEGGYRLTHIGGIEKAAGTSFLGKDADEFLKALRFFLSFAKGDWCNPVCAVGFDASGNRVWESWSSPSGPWHTLLSWFDPQNASQLASLFPGFMKRWENDDWREALHEVIYWYLIANQSSHGIDAGIILTQTGIERLSYEFSVKDRQLHTVKKFKSLRASDKFRLLFSSVNIPLNIPGATAELQRLATNSQISWIDAPHALSEIRNSLVHPEHNRRGQVYSAYYEAWNLGLWYLEMSILAICGYSGIYGNRLTQKRVGQVEDVPWEK